MNNNGYEKNLKPTKLELEFLTLAYNAFYDIFEEVFTDTFWHNSPYYRFSKIKDAFAIYSELLNYEPIKHAINDIKIKRPPMEGKMEVSCLSLCGMCFLIIPSLIVGMKSGLISLYPIGIKMGKLLTVF